MSKKSSIPKISVITPSFNQGQYLEQTIKSVVDQNYPKLEYLIFDGGSTDNSVEIIKKYALKYPFIYWESKKDKGQVDAINKGLKKVTGDIIAYINSDDYYLPGSFASVSDYFLKHPECMWLVGRCDVTQKNLKWTFWLKSIWPIDKYPWALQVFNTINQPAVFLRKSLIDEVGLFNDHYIFAFDYEYWLRCLKISMLHKLLKPISVFRVHGKSLGSVGFDRQFKEDLELHRQYTQNQFVSLLHIIGSHLTIMFYRLLK